MNSKFLHRKHHLSACISKATSFRFPPQIMHVHHDNYNTNIEVSQMVKPNNFKSLMSRTVKSNNNKKRNILIQTLNYIAYETDNLFN